MQLNPCFDQIKLLQIVIQPLNFNFFQLKLKLTLKNQFSCN
jgi:hypothetical protein